MSSPPYRRRLFWLVALMMVFGGGGLAVRYWLGGYLVRSALALAGASEIRFAAVRGMPGLIEIDHLSFRIRAQSFSARRVVLDRAQWWSASWGKVRVEGARFAVFLDGSDVDPWNWSTYEGAGPDEGVALPFVSLDLDGQLVVRAVTEPDVALDVLLEGRPKSGVSWVGTLKVAGPGFHLTGEGALLRAGQELEFTVTDSELDLATWSGYIHRLVLLPGSPWTLAGKLRGTAQGRVTAKRFAATAKLALREGKMQVSRRDVAALGAEADLVFSDLWKYRTETAALRLEELRIGRLRVRDVKADFGLWGARTVLLHTATGETLGGRIALGSFRYYTDQPEAAFALQVDGIHGNELLALTPDITFWVPGRLDGRLGVRIHATGVRVETGFLAWRPEGNSVLTLDPQAAMRSGAKLDEVTARLFRSAGAEPLPLSLRELRLDIRQPGLPLGSSGLVHVEGEADGTQVSLDYFVNGSIERYLELGL